MKKKLITIAVAAALAPAAALADATVYGRVHVSYDSVTSAGLVNSTSVNSSSSRFGVRGGEGLGDDLKVVYQLETGVNVLNNNNGAGGAGDGNPGGGAPGNTLFTGMRTSYIGLAGDFGTFKVGRLDFGEQYVYDSNLFADQIGDAANLLSGNNYINGRANGMLQYATPNRNGFDAALSYLPASSVDATFGTAPSATSGGNSYGIKLNYANTGAAVHFAYFNVDTTSTTTLKPISLAGSYDFGKGMLTAQYLRSKADVAGVSATQSIYNIGGSFNVTGNSAIKAQYSKANDLTGTANSGDLHRKMHPEMASWGGPESVKAHEGGGHH